MLYSVLLSPLMTSDISVAGRNGNYFSEDRRTFGVLEIALLKRSCLDWVSMIWLLKISVEKMSILFYLELVQCRCNMVKPMVSWTILLTRCNRVFSRDCPRLGLVPFRYLGLHTNIWWQAARGNQTQTPLAGSPQHFFLLAHLSSPTVNQMARS